MYKVLSDADAVESVLERQADQVESIASRGTCNIAAHAACMLTIRSALTCLYWVRRVPVAAGDGHGPAVLGAEALEAFHEVGQHPIEAGVLAIKLGFSEVGVVGPVHCAT